MKNKIPQFLKEEFDKYRSYANKFPNDIKQFIIDYGKFYDFGYEDDVVRIFKLMKQGISEIPECELDGCNNKKMIKKFEARLSKGCCSQHAVLIGNLEKFGVTNPNKCETVKNKRKNTLLKKYGTTHYSKTYEFKEKYKNTMLEKYGYDHFSKTVDFKEKILVTNMERFGGVAPACSAQVREKMKNSTLLKFGVENAMQNVDVRTRMQNTVLNKYGVENVSQANEIKDKKKDTLLKKFGVTHPSHIPEVAEKILKNRFKRKEYKWKTGEISLVQGYEDQVLFDLENNGYKFEDVVADEKDMPEIFYEFEGKRRRYYPDIFIPKENLIIEVKSDYTLNKEWEKNQAKFDATKKLGFNFKLDVR